MTSHREEKCLEEEQKRSQSWPAPTLFCSVFICNVRARTPPNARNPFSDRQLVNSRHSSRHGFCMPHIETPQKTLPPQTPRVSFCGDQLILLTSYSHCQDALGPRSVPLAGTGFRPVWLIRSHINTRLSSAPEARCPLRVGDHSMVLIDAS